MPSKNGTAVMLFTSVVVKTTSLLVMFSGYSSQSKSAEEFDLAGTCPSFSNGGAVSKGMFRVPVISLGDFTKH